MERVERVVCYVRTCIAWWSRSAILVSVHTLYIENWLTEYIHKSVFYKPE